RGDEEFGTGVNALGGAVTRLVRIDGGPDSGPILRLKGSGMFCQNIEFYGRRTGANINRGSKTVSNATNAEPIVITTTAPHGYSTGDVINVFGVDGNSAANGEWTITVVSSTTFSLDGSVGNDDYTGDGWVADPLCQFGILLEGRESGPGGSVSTGKHVFINFGIYGCERAIGFLDGYDDGEGFVQENQHADESLWLDGRIVGCKTAVWSVNYQAVWHTFERLVVGGAGGVNPTVVLDVVRGGLWRVNDLHLGPVPLTILRVWSFKDSPNNEWSPNTARFHIHFYRDGGGNSEQVFRLFEYHAVPNGGGQYPDAEFRVWDVRFTGSIAGQNASQYDPLEFVRFHDAELNAVPCTNIWFDVYNLYTNQDFSGTPLAGYTWEQQGPWWRLVKPLP
ncbi:MAG TPA: hypothetical protein PKC18_14765, partial [Lacipirellulaceae bacterium]|nr:hypothetical protein [Lacipirellulaceae bacterium]